MLSGWEATDAADLPDLSRLSDGGRASGSVLRDRLFSSSVGFSQASMNIDARILDALVTSVILNHDCMRRARQSPYARRMSPVMQETGLGNTDLKQWALELHTNMATARP